MWPIVFRLGDGGDAALFSYPLLVSLAYFLALAIWYRLSRPYALEPAKLINLSLLACLWGWLGARGLYVLTQVASGDFDGGFWELWKGGVVFYGGALAGGAYLYGAFPRAHIPRHIGFNTLAPAIAAAHGLGRVGCFLNGCCFGSPCDLPWAVSYTNPYSAAPLHEALHPTQIYEAAALFALALFLALRLRAPERAGRWSNVRVYVIAYALLRFALEYVRGDLQRGSWGPFSTSQWISLALLAGALFTALLLDFRRRRGHN